MAVFSVKDGAFIERTTVASVDEGARPEGMANVALLLPALDSTSVRGGPLREEES